ncbi:MAG: polyprenyl synthetase family protein [Pseudolabrys sp.]|jgi:farnesyl diphosphate synthase
MSIAATRPGDEGAEGQAAFLKRLSAVAKDTESLLDRLLAVQPAAGETARPQRLLEAMRYVSLGSGKRFRPFLIVESAALFDVPRQQALMAAAALECVHCYSLAHDDLPAMDNDDLRRGRPTAHKQFDEATAILAGDGLLTFAFDILAREECSPDAKVRIDLVAALTRAAGIGGMAGGQMLDLAAEGRFAGAARPSTVDDVLTLQAMKTGALIRFGCVAGALLAGAHDERYAALERFGAVLGQAFQIADDLLDVEGDPAKVGKQTHKDDAAGKATIVNLLGVPQARTQLGELVSEAADALSVFGAKGAVLAAAARFVAERQA